MVLTRLTGTQNSDFLKSGSGDDFIEGLLGDDTLQSGSGDDEIFGNEGDDQLFGGSGDDQLFGDPGDDQLFGGSGDDLLLGGSGDDLFNGGSGDDFIKGGEGDDILIGYNPEADVIKEIDSLIGGAGKDTFVLADPFGVKYMGPDSYAKISDFGWQEGDKLQVYGSASDWTQTPNNNGIDMIYKGDLIASIENMPSIIPTENLMFVD